MDARPECCLIGFDLFGILGLDKVGDLVETIAAVLFTASNEVSEFLLGPVGKACLKEILHLLSLIGTKGIIVLLFPTLLFLLVTAEFANKLLLCLEVLLFLE